MASLNLRKGTRVRYGGEVVVVIALSGFNEATVQTATGDFLTASVADLLKGDDAVPPPAPRVDVRRQEKVEAYRKVLKPLLNKSNTRAEVKAAGAALGISIASTYASLARYKISNKAADLPPPTKNGGRGRPRIDPRVEKIIQGELEKKLLKRGAHDVDGFIRDTKLKVENAGLSVSVTTLRDRVSKIPPYKLKSRQSGYDEAAKTLDPHIGEHPGAAKPLAQIQCDHWHTDVEILSDDRLVVIGRAWATIAIDIHSRAVWGMYVGLASPSETTLGLAMINGMLHKEPMLQELGIETTMPMYGKPHELLLDNAGEFTGGSIQASADHFGIDLTWRPVNKPQYGAHIERLNATLAQRFKALPGATGSNITERKAFRSGAAAAFTLDDLRKQMWMMIDEYHNTPHLGLGGATPLAKWTDYYFGPSGARRPLPAAWADDDELRINWYPLEKRSIQRYGIVIDYLRYYNESIQFLVRNRAAYRHVSVRRHPLDVRRIYLLHPVRQEWCEIPCRLIGFPAASLVDLRLAKRDALKTSRKPTGEALRDIIERRMSHIAQAKQATRKAARDAARRADEDRRRKIAVRRSAPVPPKANVGKGQGVGAVDQPHPAKTSAVPAPSGFGSLLAGVTKKDIEGMFDE